MTSTSLLPRSAGMQQHEIFEVELFEPLPRDMGTAPVRLPVNVTPLPGEALASWLLRYATLIGVPAEPLLFETADAEFMATTWWRRPDPVILNRLCLCTGVDLPDLCAMTFTHWMADDADDEIPERFGRRCFQYPRPTTLRPDRYAVCPRCLAEDEVPYIRKAWTVGWVAACSVHRLALIAACPSCHTRLRLPRLRSAESFTPERCALCGCHLASVAERPAVDLAVQLQTTMLHASDRAQVELPGLGAVVWPVALALFDVLLNMVWIDTKTPWRRQLFSHIGQALGCTEELGEGRYEGLLILGWLLHSWPDHVRDAIATLRGPRPRRTLERWASAEPQIKQALEALFIPTWPIDIHDESRTWWRNWIDNLPQSATELRQRASSERLAHRRARLLALSDVREGIPVEVAADIAGVQPRTLYRWLKCGAVGGLDAALSRSTGALTQHQQVKIAEWIAGAPARGSRWRANHVQHEVLKRFDLEISLGDAGRLLRNHAPWRRRARMREEFPVTMRPVAS